MQTKGHHAIWLCATVATAVFFPGFDASAQDAKRPKTISACKGLDEKVCKGKTTECLWITPKKGKQRPYCRTRAVSKKKAT